MDRISNSFVNSLRSDKTPNKNSIKSKYNTPSPYPQRTPNANSNNNTKGKSQIGNSSSKVGKHTNITSLNNISVNKSVSPQPQKVQSQVRDRIQQAISDNKNGSGNDYKKIFNMENVMNATSSQNLSDFKHHETIMNNDISKNNQQYFQNNQYFASSNTTRILDQEIKQNKTNINSDQTNRQNINFQNNLFAQSYQNENNQFFCKDNNKHQNISHEQQNQNIQHLEPQNFFKTSYSQEKLFQGGQKSSNTSKKQDDNNNIKQQNVQINHPSNQTSSLQCNTKVSDVNSNHSKNASNIFSLRFNNTNNHSNFSNSNNSITGIAQPEIIQKNQFKQDDSVTQMPKIQRDIPQSYISSNLKDLRQLHKQQKSQHEDKLKLGEKNEQNNEKSLCFQKNVLDIIKGINDKMKYNSKKQAQQGLKVEDINEQLFKEIKTNQITQPDDFDNSLAAPTIVSNDSNKTLEDSVIQKLRQVDNQENEKNINQNPDNKFFKESIIQIGNNNNKLQGQMNNGNFRQVGTKLEQIKESNGSKNILESKNTSSLDEDSHKQSQEEQEEYLLRKQFNSQNTNLLEDEMSDLLATRKNLFGNYPQTFTKKDEIIDHNKENKDINNLSYNTIRSNKFQFDESISNQARSQKLNSKVINKQEQDVSNCSIGEDQSVETKQNITNSLLNKAFVGDTVDALSNDRNDSKARKFQGQNHFEKMITSMMTSNSSSENNNQDFSGFQDGINPIKTLDQKMGFQDISPIQSQNLGKSISSASKKDNSQLIHELQNMDLPIYNTINFNDSNSFGIQMFNSLSFDQGKNTTFDISTKKQDNIRILNENIITPYSKDQNNNKNFQINNKEIDQGNFKYEESQTPIIQQKLKQFLEEFGYYSNQQKQNQINQIMTKIAIGLTADNENNQKQQQYIYQYRNILEDGINRQSLGQQSDYKSCLSRFSLNMSDIGELDEQQISDTLNEQNKEKCNDLKEHQLTFQEERANEDIQQIENKHLEILNKEVEFLYQLCKGEDQAEKQISQKIVNDILCPKFGKKSLQEAIKQAIKKSRSIRASADNKEQKGDTLEDKTIISFQTIIEKEEEDSINNKSEEVINSTIFNDQQRKPSVINQNTSANLKRKAPSRKNTRNKTQSVKGQVNKTSISSSTSLIESDQEQISSQNVSIENLNTMQKQDDKNKKKKQTKKFKK